VVFYFHLSGKVEKAAGTLVLNCVAKPACVRQASLSKRRGNKKQNTFAGMDIYTFPQICFQIQRFEKEELPKSEWTHEAHLAVAIWYVSKLGFEKALVLV
jgi:hypothetical protein